MSPLVLTGDVTAAPNAPAKKVAYLYRFLELPDCLPQFANGIRTF